MGQRLSVGIIGLGRRWRRRYAPALRALADRFEVAAVCDQIPQRAATEAGRLGCPAAAGPSDLVRRDDVAAVLLLDLGWPRLWLLGRAARAGKPVFCLPSLEDDADNADALARQVREAGVPVLMAGGLVPAALPLADLVRENLGPVRLLLCDVARRRPGEPDSGLVGWLLGLLGATPETVTAAGNEPAGLTSLTLDAAGGRALQLTTWHAPGARPALRLRVVAEHGQATLDAPRRLCWHDAAGAHALTLPRARPVEQVQLTHFHRIVVEGQAPWPSLENAHRALGCLRAAARSREAGCKVLL